MAQMKNILPVMPLRAKAFAPFGQVIAPACGESFPINQGAARRFHALAQVDIKDGAAILSIFRTRAPTNPVTIKMLERHPLGSQAFMPLSCHPWLVVVATGSLPIWRNCRAFLARGDQGVQYGRNIWHHPLLITAKTQDFLVVDRLGGSENLEEHVFALEDYATLGRLPDLAAIAENDATSEKIARNPTSS